jgi:hypothetical protein
MRAVQWVLAGAQLLAAAMAAAPAAGTVLVFGPDSCGGPASCADFSMISQEFGDTGTVNLSYRSASGPGNTATVGSRPLRYSDGGVSGSNGAFVLPGDTTDQQAEIRFDLLSAGTITLNSVDFGTVFGSAATLAWAVYDTDWTMLGSGNVLLDPAGFTTVSFNVSSAIGLVLQFGAASLGGGVQSISYSRAEEPAPSLAVPEPASWALLVAGFSMVGSIRRRRVRRALA